MYQPNSQPVKYVVCLGSSLALAIWSLYSLTIGSSASAGSVGSLMYWMRYVSLPVRPWSISGLKNWPSEAQVADMISVGFHAPFSTFAMPCVHQTPLVSRISVSAPEADALVYWLSMFGAVGSCEKSPTRVMPVPLMA